MNRSTSLQVMLALALACGCGSDSPPGGGDVTQHPSQGGSGGAPAQTQPDSGVTPSTPSGDAGPYQNYPIFDGSTTPTANYVRGVDAAAAEDARGFADEPDAGP